MDNLGTRLASARMSAGLSQAKLATLLGVTRGTITRWENGTRAPSDEDKHRLSRTLNVSIAYLMGETDEPGSQTQKKPGASARPEVIPFTDLVSLPILDPTSIACAGHGNGGMDTIHLEASESVYLPRKLVGTISTSSDQKPFCITVEGDSMEGPNRQPGSGLLRGKWGLGREMGGFCLGDSLCPFLEKAGILGHPGAPWRQKKRAP